ncbi:MAG: hypothetical protein PUA51_08340 [Oscillospiraceae bacterium]|nr:hypothetical protein [Oscillospiraceae bacterium]
MTNSEKYDIVVKSVDWNMNLFFADLQRTAVAENAVIGRIPERP